MSDKLVRLFEQTSARGVLSFDEAGSVRSSHGAIETYAAQELATVLGQLADFGNTAGLGAPVEIVVQSARRASITRRREGSVFFHLQTERMTELTNTLVVLRSDLSAKRATPAAHIKDSTAPAPSLEAMPRAEGATAVVRDRRPTERTPPPRGAVLPSSDDHEIVTEEVDFRTRETLIEVGESDPPRKKKG